MPSRTVSGTPLEFSVVLPAGVRALVLIVLPVVVVVWELHDSARLVPVEGSITRVSYQQVPGRGGRLGDMGYVNVRYHYRYTFAGRQYDRVEIRNSPESSVQSGSTVTVWIDPLDPSQGTLERGPRWWLLLVSAVMAPLLAAAWNAHRSGSTA